MRRYFFLILSFCLLISNLYSQRPAYEWIRTAQGLYWDEALSIACDDEGNSIATGYFEGVLNIGDSTFNSGTHSDIFIIKHDPFGNLVLAKQLSAIKSAYGESVCLDNSGNVYLTGTFEDSIYINSTMYYGYSNQTGFIAKFDQNGNIEWFNIIGGDNGWIWPTDLVVLNNDNITVSGIFGGTVTIGDSVYNSSNEATFISHYSTSGAYVAGKKAIECSYLHETFGIACDNLDNIYVSGNFQGSLFFSDTNITSTGDRDIFIAKFNSENNFQWARQEGNAFSDVGMDVAVDQQGNAAITGYFSDAITVGDTTLTALGNGDIFIIKYNPVGTVLWARNAGANTPNDYDESNGISADDKGNFYLTGIFKGSAFFGDTTVVSSGMTDIFCAKYDSAGECNWAAKIGGASEEWGNDISVNNQGDIFLSGWYNSTFMFRDTLVTHTDATEVCVIKLTDSEINSIRKRSNYPNQYKLSQNYPNPFNPSTMIEFSVPKTRFVTLKIYNILGQEIATLVSEKLKPNDYKYIWNASEFSSGIYFYKLESDDFVETKKMILLQ